MKEQFSKIKMETLTGKENPKEIFQRAMEETEKIEIVRSPEGKLLTKEGSVSSLQNELHWKIVRTEAFKKWFGDWEKEPKKASKVVDENGEPLLVFQGTNIDFYDDLKPQKYGLLGKGIYFAPTNKGDRSYGNRFYVAFLNIKNLDVIPEESINNTFIKDLSYVLDLKGRYYSFIRPKNSGRAREDKEKQGVYEYMALHSNQVMLVPFSEEDLPEKKKSFYKTD